MGARPRPPFWRTQRGRRWLIGGGVVLGAAAAGWMASLLLYPASLVAREQRLALVIGLPVEQAERELERQGFRVKVLPSREPDPTLPAGYVAWQEPPAYMELPEGSQIDLTVSEGPASVTVPDLLHFNLGQARRILTAAGLSPGPVDSVPASAEDGVVVSTRPAAGTPVRPGSAVGLVVSRGPAAIRVPDLSGMIESAARARLEELGLRIGTVRRVRPGRQPSGIVTEQRPRPGTLSARGGRVDLTVTDARIQ